MPLLRISIGYDENYEKMVQDNLQQMEEMFTKAGFANFKTVDSK